MEIKFFDTHCHLQFPQYEKDREEVIERARGAGVGVINVGTDLESSGKAIELAEKYPEFMWATVGIHPTDVNDTNIRMFTNDTNEFTNLARQPKVVAIGECGLDYAVFARKHSERLQKRAPRRSPPEADEGGLDEGEIKDKQKEIFRKQIDSAIEVGKPLVLHLREAYDDALEILSEYKNLTGTSHFFSGTLQQAQKFLELGFHISFAGPITFAKEYEEVVKFVPLERILAETDAPFASPLPWRCRGG